MTIYTVHEPSAAVDPLVRADGTVIMPDRFNGWAFIFGPFFLLWHRLWIALAVWVVLDVVLVGAALGLKLPFGLLVPVALVFRLFLGIEGNDLRRWSLERRGHRFAAVVSEAGRSDAERAFFHNRMVEEPAGVIPPSGAMARSGPMSPVIGMFDEGLA